MLLTALCTSVMMYSLVYAPNDAIMLSALLFLAGFLPQTSATRHSRSTPWARRPRRSIRSPTDSSTLGGQLGGAVAPLAVGMILDAYNWNVVFMGPWPPRPS